MSRVLCAWGSDRGTGRFVGTFCLCELLTRKVVQNVHLSGGSLLGVSRGGPIISEIVDNMKERGINMLFVLGGNGTHAGANVIHKEECCRRGVKVDVVGVPKTIDNDILLMDKTFGFDTAVEEAQRAINLAYIKLQIFITFCDLFDFILIA
ncbi:ATP-dependent 6-phosphofructokinase 5, chloroplastic-like [Humulus lupulus]|uniref:ATP-dependent 6-phosphofructokinase 5, chloroplastic-like n=1 Tax=Humulus lupulus TaxID=3486 RepID=UPI002B410E60|nr:ATP-dependent 6-phosphofructokinase 5, chloroplastic-like [Humulus lupulus]